MMRNQFGERVTITDTFRQIIPMYTYASGRLFVPIQPRWSNTDRPGSSPGYRNFSIPRLKCGHPPVSAKDRPGRPPGRSFVLTKRETTRKHKMKQTLAIVLHSILISGALVAGSWASPHGHNVHHGQVHTGDEVSHQKDGHKNLPYWENEIWQGQVWSDFL